MMGGDMPRISAILTLLGGIGVGLLLPVGSIARADSDFCAPPSSDAASSADQCGDIASLPLPTTKSVIKVDTEANQVPVPVGVGVPVPAPVGVPVPAPVGVPVPVGVPNPVPVNVAVPVANPVAVPV